MAAGNSVLETEAWLYVFAGGVSCVTCLILIYLQLRYKELSVFPSKILFYRSICDLLGAIATVILNIEIILLNKNETADRSLCLGGLLALLTQFSLFGSFAWYFFLSVTLYLTVSNPFIRPASYMPYFHVWVWLAATTTGIITLFEYDFRTNFGICWVKEETGEINVYNLFLLWIWIAVCFLLSIGTLLYTAKQLSSGWASKTLQLRKVQLSDTRRYLISQTILVVVVGCLWFYKYLQENKTNQKLVAWPSYMFALALGSMGFVNSAIWTSVQWTKIKKCLNVTSDTIFDIFATGNLNDDDGIEFDDISDATRFEFISFSAAGMRRAANESQNLLELSNKEAVDWKFSTSSRVLSLVHQNLRVPFERTESMASTDDYLFEEHAPVVFAKIREVMGITSDSYIASVAGSETTDLRSMTTNFSEGKSGSFFYFSLDKKYLVKTLSEEEHLFLRDILLNYFVYVSEHPHTLLSRFIGWYSITMYGHTEHIVVMENVLLSDSLSIAHQKYDLKGSVIGRYAGRSAKVMKDLDLHRNIQLQPDAAMAVFQAIVQDCKFLRDQGIMDYSLLLGIHTCTETRLTSSHCNGISREKKLQLETAEKARKSSAYPEDEKEGSVKLSSIQIDGDEDIKESERKLVDDEEEEDDNEESARLLGDEKVPQFRTLSASVIEGPGIYYMGIIDVLEQWSLRKKSEHWLKVIFKCYYGQKRFLISAVEPKIYAERFIGMMAKLLNIPPLKSLDIDDEESVKQFFQ